MIGENKTYFFDKAFVGGIWQENVLIHVGMCGFISAIEVACEPVEGSTHFSGLAMPAMGNAHSHAFQRAFAGLAEYKGAGAAKGADDNFWSWRKEMYGFLAQLNPDDVSAISTQLYVEMLKRGYASVAEFHYLHNDLDGQAYTDKAIMSKAIIEGAKQAGIALTMVPVLYQRAGFDGQDLAAEQQRFYLSTDDYLKLFSDLDVKQKAIGFHSLRAVSLESIQDVYSSIIETSANDASAKDASAPDTSVHDASDHDTSVYDAIRVHIHIAEQVAEVEACMAAHNARPVQYLYNNLPVDERWCLVHATHANEVEVDLMARSQVVVALCPSTEANLGDGIFPIQPYLAAGGHFAIGSDSHVTVDPAAELRQLEYTERLLNRGRIMLTGGQSLWLKAQKGGAQAQGQNEGLAVGASADIIVLDQNHPSLFARADERIFDSFIMTSHSNPISHVISAGNWVIKHGHHKHEENILNIYNKTIISIMERR